MKIIDYSIYSVLAPRNLCNVNPYTLTLHGYPGAKDNILIYTQYFFDLIQKTIKKNIICCQCCINFELVIFFVIL